jgi:hypothetical protein
MKRTKDAAFVVSVLTKTFPQALEARPQKSTPEKNLFGIALALPVR